MSNKKSRINDIKSSPSQSTLPLWESNRNVILTIKIKEGQGPLFNIEWVKKSLAVEYLFWYTPFRFSDLAALRGGSNLSSIFLDEAKNPDLQKRKMLERYSPFFL